MVRYLLTSSLSFSFKIYKVLLEKIDSSIDQLDNQSLSFEKLIMRIDQSTTKKVVRDKLLKHVHNESTSNTTKMPSLECHFHF